MIGNIINFKNKHVKEVTTAKIVDKVLMVNKHLMVDEDYDAPAETYYLVVCNENDFICAVHPSDIHTINP